MGWGAASTVKRHVMRGSSIVVPQGSRAPWLVGKYKHIVFDFNAWFRSFAHDIDTSPRKAISQFWNSVLKNHDAGIKSVTICFDDYERLNEMRQVYYDREDAKMYKQRYNKG
jgi:hypothetical protein